MNLIEKSYCPEYHLFKNLPPVEFPLVFRCIAVVFCQCSGEIMIPRKIGFCGKEEVIVLFSVKHRINTFF